MTAPVRLEVPEDNVDAVERMIAEADILESVSPEFHQLFKDLRDEVIAIRSAATQADLTLILTVVQATEGEQYARQLAREAKDEKNPKDYILYTKLAESQIRTKTATLSRLGLAGDRRGSSEVRKAAFAVNNKGTATAGKVRNRWEGL